MKYQETLPTRTREFIFKTKRTRNIDIIKGIGISKASFYNWTNPQHRDYKQDFDYTIKMNRAELLDHLETEMMRQIEGRYVIEEKLIYENDILVRKITHKRWIKGNARVLIYALKEAKSRNVCK